MSSINTSYLGPLERTWIGRTLARLHAGNRKVNDLRDVETLASPAPGSRHGDLSARRVEAILDHYNVTTLGRSYVFVPAARRTTEHHPIPVEVGSLVLADHLSGAASGIGEWHVGPPSEDLMGSLVLGKATPERVLRDASVALRKAISVQADVDVDANLRADCLVAELFTRSGRKVAGLLAEVGEDGTVLLCFCLRVNEPNNHALPLGETSLMLEAGREFPRDALLGEFLTMLELMVLPRDD